MSEMVKWLEGFFGSIPLPLLEGWGRLAFLLGFALMILAFGGFTLKPGGKWGFGTTRQNWDTKALFSSVLTFVLILGSGYLGSLIVLVPGAQTFESLKDLMVFLCIALFGYPALLIVPFAYGLSDLIEGVPPGFMLDWFFGYFINPACFWLAFQFFGRKPDFSKIKTWSWYLLFVLIFMSIEPLLWGYICAGKFTAAFSFRAITPALFFTTSITWLVAPFAMLAAYPLVRKVGLFWADIPGHVREKVMGRKEWVWISGREESSLDGKYGNQGVPIRLVIAVTLILFVLTMIVAGGYLTQRSGEASANKLAGRIHQEVSENLHLRLDEYLSSSGDSEAIPSASRLRALLNETEIAKQGRAFLIDRSGRVIASSGISNNSAGALADPIVVEGVEALQSSVGLHDLKETQRFHFDVITAKPLSRETWLAQATPYQYRGGRADWIQITAIPASYYLEGVRIGYSQTAQVLVVALTLSVLIAIFLANLLNRSIRVIMKSVQAIAEGDLTKTVPGSQLEEFSLLSEYLNRMASQLQEQMDLIRQNERRLKLATTAGNIGVWDWDIEKNILIWDDSMYTLYGIRKEDFNGAYEAWSRTLHPDDRDYTEGEIQAAIRGEREYSPEFRVVRPDGAVRNIKAASLTYRAADGKAIRMIGTNVDITERKMAEDDIRNLNRSLEEKIRASVEEIRQKDHIIIVQSRQAAMGEMLSNIAHQWRQPLNTLALSVQNLCNRVLEASPDPEYVGSRREKMMATIQLMSDTINDFRDFFKPGKTPEKFRISDSINRIRNMIDPAIQSSEVRLDVELISDAEITGFPNEYGQVLINLINNARETLAEREIRNPIIRIRHEMLGNFSVLTVTDNAGGIDPAIFDKIFEPYFTTRENGTGLGLYMCKTIIEKNMEGKMTARNVPGGAEFRIEVKAEVAS